MRIAFLSDIHGNREALESCLAHARGKAPDRYVVLGDIVGYGADPAFCVETVAGLVAGGAVAIKGNHDAAVGEAARTMTDMAHAAIVWTRGALAAAHHAFLAGLPLAHRDGERLYVHASADRPAAWPYLTSETAAERSLAATDARQVFSGHTHQPVLFRSAGGVCRAMPLPAGAPVRLDSAAAWQVVIGSVGQPRDGNPAAAYAVLDLDTSEITQHRLDYDHAAAAAKILAAGLPRRLAERLALGR
ncbi:metallophosphoesterase family protein [Phreatobacter sp. AB_2022a]|uniref:metallophosphoesterase family protein n=1 Tax=Phreatobacter sp. AB_2022a TaxID=3003134 RepID=UPI0022871E12|nr:metallophosphoesterase family protein [Phreatobacter sp. AB_2022a]MCZ0732896.1 metallophosphoesterase family protein [Phreatobacter sp. AB_2022a]